MGDPRTMVKKVNVIANIPVRTISPAMQGKYFGVAMTPANILKCLNARAIVDEILPDGTKVRLTKKNYNQDNTQKTIKKAPELDVLKSAVSEEDKVVKNKIIKGVEDVRSDDSEPGEQIINEDDFDKIQGADEIPTEEISEDHLAEVNEIDCTAVEESALASDGTHTDTSDIVNKSATVIELVTEDVDSTNKYIQQYNKSKKHH